MLLYGHTRPREVKVAGPIGQLREVTAFLPEFHVHIVGNVVAGSLRLFEIQIGQPVFDPFLLLLPIYCLVSHVHLFLLSI